MSLSANSSNSSQIMSTNTQPSPVASDNKSPLFLVEKVDRISSLPDHVLLMILSNISSEDAIKTSVLSKRWENLWKQLTSFAFDIFTFNFYKGSLANRSEFIAEVLTKVVRNINGNLDAFITPYFSYQSKDGTWIRKLTRTKHTKCLALVNPLGHHWKARELHLFPRTFSHPSLTTLQLFQYDLQTPRAFNNCVNLNILKLENVSAEIDIFNRIIESCSSLKILELYISWHNPMGCLKIHNNNLKLLRLRCSYVMKIDISANILDILSIDSTFATKDDVFLAVPRLLKFNNIHRVDDTIPHLNYNLSCDAQDEENIVHGFVVNRDNNYLERYTSLAVSVNLRNPREVEKLNEVLLAWNAIKKELEIVFQESNDPKEEGESSVGGSQKMKRKEEKLVVNTDFRVDVVWMYNFDGTNEKHFALASRFVTEGVVVKKLMIKTSSFAEMKPEMETAVAELLKLPKGRKKLSIECF